MSERLNFLTSPDPPKSCRVREKTRLGRPMVFTLEECTMKEENNRMFHLHEGIKYATLYDKESSKFSKVSYAGKIVTPEEERWIVFPYEEWWK